MANEPSDRPSGALVLAVALASVAGYIDAHIFLHVTPVFVANMSGNFIQLGIAAGTEAWRPAAGSIIAVLAFVGGVTGATIHHARQIRCNGKITPGIHLAVETGLVLLLPILLTVLSIDFTAKPTARTYLVLLAGGLAMGIQAAGIRYVGQIAITTTYASGATVRIGEKVALALRGPDDKPRDRWHATLGVLTTIICGYVGGAALAAALGSSPTFLLVPTVTLAAATVAVAVRSASLGGLAGPE